MWKGLLAMIKFLENYCRKHIGSQTLTTSKNIRLPLISWWAISGNLPCKMSYELLYNVAAWQQYQLAPANRANGVVKARELSVPMTTVLNTRISCSKFPAVLKCVELNPVYKKKDKLAEENYRLVSVLTALSKIYESSLNDQLLRHFITMFKGFLSVYQKEYSCQSLLVKVIDDWLDWICLTTTHVLQDILAVLHK